MSLTKAGPIGGRKTPGAGQSKAKPKLKPDLCLLARINQVAIGEVPRTAPHSIQLVDPVNLAPGMPFSTQRT